MIGLLEEKATGNGRVDSVAVLLEAKAHVTAVDGVTGHLGCVKTRGFVTFALHPH